MAKKRLHLPSFQAVLGAGVKVLVAGGAAGMASVRKD